jgi:phosphoribosylaminoimidazole carboxylase PurE protein
MAEPRVGILIGSESDRPVMEECLLRLEALGITAELRVASAHRDPEATRAYARGAAARGLRVLVAGAGMAAHLAGAVAAETTLPVIGVPMEAGPLHGLDALLATVMMPAGVPVATMAIGKAGAANAALFAAQILALEDEALGERLAAERLAGRSR